MNLKVVGNLAQSLAHSKFTPVATKTLENRFIKAAPLARDMFAKSIFTEAGVAAKSTEALKSVKTVAKESAGVKNTLGELFNKYFKKINIGKGFVEGSKIEACEDAGLLSKDLVAKIKQSGDIFSTKDLFQMQEMHELKLYSLDDIIRFRGSEAKLTTLGANVNFKKEAELTTALEEYVENISRFVKKEPHALETSTKNIDKYISVKGQPIAEKTIYRGIIDDEEITHILSRAKSSNPANRFYTPNRITSTSKDIAEASRASQKKCVLKIEVPNGGTEKAAKSIDINKYYDARGMKNDFAFQKEVLLPSNCKFQLGEVTEKDGTIFVNAKLAQ